MSALRDLTVLGKRILLAACDLIAEDANENQSPAPEDGEAEWCEHIEGCSEGWRTDDLAKRLNLARHTVAGALGTLIPAGWCHHGKQQDPNEGHDTGQGDYIYPSVQGWRLWFQEKKEGEAMSNEKPMTTITDVSGQRVSQSETSSTRTPQGKDLLPPPPKNNASPNAHWDFITTAHPVAAKWTLTLGNSLLGLQKLYWQIGRSPPPEKKKKPPKTKVMHGVQKEAKPDRIVVRKAKERHGNVGGWHVATVANTKSGDVICKTEAEAEKVLGQKVEEWYQEEGKRLGIPADQRYSVWLAESQPNKSCYTWDDARAAYIAHHYRDAMQHLLQIPKAPRWTDPAKRNQDEARDDYHNTIDDLFPKGAIPTPPEAARKALEGIKAECERLLKTMG